MKLDGVYVREVSYLDGFFHGRVVVDYARDGGDVDVTVLTRIQAAADTPFAMVEPQMKELAAAICTRASKDLGGV